MDLFVAPASAHIQPSCASSSCIFVPHRSSLTDFQRGSIALMFALLLIPILGICAVALDIAMVYNRKADMHSVAKAVAISAARSLNGTPDGIDKALSNAASTAAVTKFKNFSQSISWSSDALKFGTSSDPNGQWLNAAGAASMASRIFYVKADTSELADAGTVHTAFARVLSEALATVPTNSEVIAGRTGIAVAPLAICAMSNIAAAPRMNTGLPDELVQYGFRRGVSYDLMNLNPNGMSPLNFVVNPLSMPGSPGSPADFAVSTVGPYACSGTLGIPGIAGGTISVATPFPLPQLFRQLNSRFDLYDGDVCRASTAPPDYNIRSYSYKDLAKSDGWMTTALDVQTADVSKVQNRLQTIADLPSPGGPAAKYGPLWAFSKAVAYSTYLAKPVEPAAGYTTMTTAAWPLLYGTQVAKSTYPPSVPYMASSGINLIKPSAAHAPGIRNRRVLNVPLLDCSATPSSRATVLAVGKFFMTVPATETALAAEFAGTIPFERIAGFTGLFE